MEQLPTVLGALILAAILWMVRATTENSRLLSVLQETVEKNILPEITRLRNGQHELRDIAQDAVAGGDLLEQRVGQAETQIILLWKENDRRSGSDRRAI
jgi:hypothetical protein